MAALNNKPCACDTRAQNHCMHGKTQAAEIAGMGKRFTSILKKMLSSYMNKHKFRYHLREFISEWAYSYSQKNTHKLRPSA